MAYAVTICPACGARLMPTGDTTKARCPCGHAFDVTETVIIQTPDEKRAAHRKAEDAALPTRFTVNN